MFLEERRTKSLPDINELTKREIRSAASVISDINPFLQRDESYSTSIIFKGKPVPCKLLRDSAGRLDYVIEVGPTLSIVQFDCYQLNNGFPKALTETKQPFLSAEVQKMISKIPGQGFGTLTVHLLDEFFDILAKTYRVPLFAFADDDSSGRWTKAVFESLGYTPSPRGFLSIPLLWRGPRMSKWYYKSIFT